jgi:hypothetical protein
MIKDVTHTNTHTSYSVSSVGFSGGSLETMTHQESVKEILDAS